MLLTPQVPTAGVATAPGTPISTAASPHQPTTGTSLAFTGFNAELVTSAALVLLTLGIGLMLLARRAGEGTDLS